LFQKYFLFVIFKQKLYLGPQNDNTKSTFFYFELDSKEVPLIKVILVKIHNAILGNSFEIEGNC